MEFEPTTDEFWEIDGLVLNTLAWNISKWGDGRRTVPDLRGDNIVVPHRPGEIYVPKVAEAGNITLAMWVRGSLPNGSPPTKTNARGQFNHNWQELYKHLWKSDRQVEIVRRTKQGDSSIRRDTALGEFVSGLEPDMQGPNGAAFTVSYKLADPYFYGEKRSIVLTDTFKVDSSSDDNIVKLQLTVNGLDTGESTVISNITTGESLTIDTSKIGSFDSAYPIEIDTDRFTVKNNGNSRAAWISKSGGSVWWLTLRPGINELEISNGSCVVEWQEIRF